MDPVRALVFDVGGVLIEWDFRHIYREMLPTEAEIDWFLTTICTLEWHAQHDRGRPLAEGVAELIAGAPPSRARGPDPGLGEPLPRVLERPDHGDGRARTGA